MTGGTLRLTARLMESSLTGPMLRSTALKQLQIPLLRGMDIPPDVAPYLPVHLYGPPAVEGGGHE